MPSVTEILKPWSNFDGVRQEVLEAAADRGQRVHAACHAYVMGLFDNPGEDVQGYVDGFKSWFDRSIDNVFGAEIELWGSEFSPFNGIVGHPDLIAKMKGEETLTLIDIKTPLTFIPIWNVQLSAYKALAVDNGILNIKRTVILRLNPKKNAIFTECHDPGYFNLGGFIKAYDAWKFFHNLKG